MRFRSPITGFGGKGRMGSQVQPSGRGNAALNRSGYPLAPRKTALKSQPYRCENSQNKCETTVSDKGREAIEYARQIGDGRRGNLIPREMSEKQWRNACTYRLRRHGITKAQAGASFHGLRHAYAQERYRQITGFECRAKFGSQEEFRAAAQNVAGADWSKLDRDARRILKPEMGHGPDRGDVVSQYLGSSTS